MEIPQGDRTLLGHETAQRLLGGAELARLAYLATDGTPRVIPVMFTWTGDEFVVGTFPGSPKVAALRANPAVAVTVDVPGPPPEILQLRGRVTVADVDGMIPEYAAAHVRYYGEEQGSANVAGIDQPGLRMIRIGLRPDWVGVLDFRTRFPQAVR